MGQWQQKVVAAQILARIGPEAFAKLDGRSPLGSSLILPPGAKVKTLFETAAADIEAAAQALGFLSEIEAGSNSWAVHGTRTTTGRPVVCNDSHRALDVPNAYWQVHVSCPGFNVIGATFAGLPGFPHFGNNGDVAWNITHTSADYQDLYIEEFDPENPGRYRTPDGWAEADRRSETINVRDGDLVEIETWETRHGPVVHGDPRSGHALALRYTATDEPCRGFEALRPMIEAATVEELFDAQRPWVDPVNNLVAADAAGNIGYLTRGRIPTRSSPAGRQFPVPGWTGEHEWTGNVPVERLLRSINPPEGYIATANQRVIDSDDPYISATFAVPSRADRLVELLHDSGTLSPAQIAVMQGDTTSVPAKTWVRLLRRQRPMQGDAEKARAILAGWDGNLLPTSNAALLYAYFRRRVARAVFEPVIGKETYDWLVSESSPPLARFVGQWLSNVVAGLDARHATEDPNGRAWSDILPAVLSEAWALAVESGGPDPAAWRWDAKHGTRPRHALGFAFPELAEQLDPPRAMVGGDSDTLQCATYGSSGRSDFNITALSVYRQVVDFARPDRASFVVPTGVSGQPGTPHYGDQVEHWRKHERIAAWLNEDDVLAAAEHELTLRPG
jgi:penicillin amidase